MSLGVIAADLAAGGAFTDWLVLPKEANLSVAGTWVGTITLQRTFDNGTTIKDVETYTANQERVLVAPEVGIRYRMGFKAGQYTSGTAVCRLSY